MPTAAGRLWLAATAAAVLAAGAWIAFRLWPRTIEVPFATALTPTVEFQQGVASVRTPGRALVADVAIFDDELFAYMMFSYLRGFVARDGHSAWLNYTRKDNALAYVVRIGLPDDYLAGLAYLYRLRQEAGIEQTAHRWVTADTVARYQAQSAIFDQAYNLPARKRLESLPRDQLVAYVKRFIRFKAATDPRVRRRMQPVPALPSRPEAHRLAEDIVTVADFFGLPLDFFLGIGAMENNYMNVQGDLGNTIWKRRPEKGDVVLKRGKRGVLVLNESSGVWQITRETLRYAHRLYLKDRRDYTRLPEHLRPPRALNVNEVPPEVLTTYAGLFLRDLLDRFDGDVATAVGAYNGGPGRPNPRYEAGVRAVAEHARRLLEHAAVLQERPAAETRFLTSAR